MLSRIVAVVVPLLLLAGCGGSSDAAQDGRLRVTASFYPLQWATAQVAGDRAEVTSLTPPGAEPHDLELGPRDVATVGEADLVVYLDGFQPAVDDAVEQEAGDASYDVTPAARLHEADAGHEHEDGDEHEPGDGHESADPHFWLDPTRLADVADGIADRLGQVDPDHAAAYADRATGLRAELEALDQDLRAGLENCAATELVTAHTAFGYLTERYGLTQVGISGLTPDAEPGPQDLAEVATFVQEHGVRTIYYETLVSPAVAETLAEETGATTAVLDPIEGLTDESAGEDYVAVMRSNLQTLRDGQRCS
jgi:zinc transport system substrate-binding protein